MPDDFKLTAKQKAFAEHYVMLGAKNAVITKAAIAAGYSPTSAAESGCENLKKSNVKQYVDKLRKPAEKKVMKKYEIDLDSIVSDGVFLLDSCKNGLKENFDPAAINAARGVLEFLAKVTGHTSDKIQLQADISTRHSVEMVKIIETDTASAAALDVILERRRQMIEAGSA